MGGHLERYQQSVMGRAAANRLRRGALVCAATVVLVTTLLQVMGAHTSETHQEASSASQKGEDAAGSDGLETYGHAAPSSVATFLDDLERASLEQQGASAGEGQREESLPEGGTEAGAASGGALTGEALDVAAEAGSVAVAWSADEGLPQAAATLLETYRDEGGAMLVTSGYLDLRGMVWGMVATGEAGWVDVAFVYAGESDSTATVRVARLRPPA